MDIAARYPELSVFGGPNDTPLDSSRFQAVQGAVLSSIVGSGPASRRYGARHVGFADERWFTLCNLAVRRSAMRPFVDHLVCAEDNAVLAELRRDGHRMRYDPTLRVFHVRRAQFESFAQQMLKYGRGRGELMRRDPTTIRAAYLAPAALLLYLAAAVVTAALDVAPDWTLGPAVLYLALTIAASLRVARTLRPATGRSSRRDPHRRGARLLRRGDPARHLPPQPDTYVGNLADRCPSGAGVMALRRSGCRAPIAPATQAAVPRMRYGTDRPAARACARLCSRTRTRARSRRGPASSSPTPRVTHRWG